MNGINHSPRRVALTIMLSVLGSHMIPGLWIPVVAFYTYKGKGKSKEPVSDKQIEATAQDSMTN